MHSMTSAAFQSPDTLDGVNAAYTVPAAAAPLQPCLWLAPDGVSAWYVLASHGV